jgi:hypothetical protein
MASHKCYGYDTKSQGLVVNYQEAKLSVGFLRGT